MNALVTGVALAASSPIVPALADTSVSIVAAPNPEASSALAGSSAAR
jgi:hypothetical protein